MKILNLIQCANLGGMEQASLRLMRGLKDHGQDVRLLSLNPIGGLAPLLQEAGIPHEGLPYLGKGGWRSYPLLKRKLREVNPDCLIMTGHHLLGTLALQNSCRGRRILAIHFHHLGVKPRWQWQFIYRIACQRFDAITFPCDFIRREAEGIFPPVAKLAHTVSNPIAVPSLATAEEKARSRMLLGLPAGRPIVGNAGWLISRKRFDVFLRVAREVLTQRPDALFVIAGGGEERAKLESLACELGISESVRWLGWLKEMAPFYRSLDVLEFNSDFDAMGLTPLEAMSHGVPVVCSVAYGGLGEVITSDVCGFLRDKHDVDELAGLVLRLLERPTEATAVGMAGRKRVESVGRLDPIVEWHVRSLSSPNGKARSETNGSPVREEAPAPVVLGSPVGTELPSEPIGPVSNTAKDRTHVAVLFSRIGPYHFSRLRAAAKTLRISAVEFSDVDSTYAWDMVDGQEGFEREKLFQGEPLESQPAARIKKTVNETLNRLQPAAVAIPGWHDRGSLAALDWCVAHSVPAILMSETTAWDYERKPWREFVKGRVVRLCAAGLVGGRSHAEYLNQLGMSRERIFLGYDTVDNEYFAAKAAEARSQKSVVNSPSSVVRRPSSAVPSPWSVVSRQSSAVPGHSALPENYFLASARFVGKKNLARLLEAYARYRKLASHLPSPISHLPAPCSPLSPPWSLVILGDGPLSSSLLALRSSLGLDAHIHLPGFKQYDELPAFYGLAGAFVHASTTEQWGLVVNEAMASGLPVLVSNRCGCAADLVREGVNGFTFNPGDVESLARLMLRVGSLEPEARHKMGVASSEIVSQWGPGRFARGLSDAVELVLPSSGERKGPVDQWLLTAVMHGRRLRPE